MVAASHMEEEQSESGDSRKPADRKRKKTSILNKITAQTVKQIIYPYSLSLFSFHSMVAASHMEEEQSESGDSNIPADRKPKKTSILDKITAQTVKQILELLCDESVSTWFLW